MRLIVISKAIYKEFCEWLEEDQGHEETPSGQLQEQKS